MDAKELLRDEDIEDYLVEDLPDVYDDSEVSEDDCEGNLDISSNYVHNIVRNVIKNKAADVVLTNHDTALDQVGLVTPQQCSSLPIRSMPPTDIDHDTTLDQGGLVTPEECSSLSDRPMPPTDVGLIDYNAVLDQVGLGLVTPKQCSSLPIRSMPPTDRDLGLIDLDTTLDQCSNLLDRPTPTTSNAPTSNCFDTVFNQLIEEATNNESSVNKFKAKPSEEIPKPKNKVKLVLQKRPKGRPIKGKAKDAKKTEKNKKEAKKKEAKKTKIEINRLWRKRDMQTVIPPYNYGTGPVVAEFADCLSATDVFLKILDKNIVSHITFQTNLYGTQQGKNLNLKEEELLVFFGINFLMGYHILPSMKHYWSTAEDLNVKPVSSAMTRTRFIDILSNLHLNDNSSMPKGTKDKVYKLRPFIDMLNSKFKAVYEGTREMSVDESMILFKGRSSLKQYNPMKPIKRGYKLWCVADQKGYIRNFEVYQGKNEQVEKEFGDSGLGERVVLSMTKGEWGKNRIVVFDNYFASVPLLERLKAESVLACATIKRDRVGLPDMTSDLTSRGCWDHRYSESEVGVFKWKDSKEVLLISNYHGTEESKVKRTQKDGSRIDVKCPVVVKDYNINMGGVDLADRYRALYQVDRKSKKWWLRLFWGLLDIAFVNSFVVYKEIFGDISVLEFRRLVSNGLITYRTPKSKKRSFDSPSMSPSPVPVKRRKAEYSIPKDIRLSNKGIHWPMFDERRGRCEVCSKKKVQSRPHSKCSACKVFLCLNEKKNCFAEFHEMDV